MPPVIIEVTPEEWEKIQRHELQLPEGWSLGSLIPRSDTPDLEDLAARDYPLTTADLDRIGPLRRPPASWYAEEGKPF